MWHQDIDQWLQHRRLGDSTTKMMMKNPKKLIFDAVFGHPPFKMSCRGLLVVGCQSIPSSIILDIKKKVGSRCLPNISMIGSWSNLGFTNGFAFTIPTCFSI